MIKYYQKGEIFMNNGQYLNEEKYQQTKGKVSNVGKILLIFGIIALVAGILMIILGFAGVGNTVESSFGNESVSTVKGIFGNFGLIALGAFVIVIGFCLTGAGAISMAIAHRREITAFTVQGTMPIAKEGIETIAPTIGNVAESISHGIEKGKQQAKQEYENK